MRNFFFRGILVICAALLGACVDQEALRKAELDQIASLLPGRYDNLTQVRGEAVGPRESLALLILPVYTPSIGRYTFYMQESAADDPLRLLSQRIYSFQIGPSEAVIQSLATFDEPQRWRNAQDNPEVFKGLMVQDLKVMGGCELTWTRAMNGFEARNDRQTCRSVSRATGSRINVELRMTLDAEGIAISEQHFDAGGRVVYGDRSDPFYRFERSQ
ncbi:MAG: chromophore lyase CpcT/CpeT [Steroidobacteraceae bacterium]